MRLLIVDDEPVIRKGLVKMVDQKRFSITEIRTASNGEQAIEMLREAEADIVLTDIRMPKMSGLELCEHIHQHYKHIQMVVISGYDDFAYAQKCVTYGVKHYLLKPLTSADLNKIIGDLIDQRGNEVISLSPYLAWIERAEQSIWLLHEQELDSLNSYWIHMIETSSLNAAQLNTLIQDCLGLLKGRLQEKGFEAQTIPLTNSTPRTKAEIIQYISQYLQFLYDELTKQRTGYYKNPLEEIKMYIDEHLAEDISLVEVAEMAGFTPTYFSAMFKKMSNETFVKYRIKTRMIKAKELLAIPHIRIVDIAATVGYEDYPHFAKMFKKTTGYTPSEYRQMIGIK
ncbi:response regulator [Paenibacillus sp. IITD108]|uniref:response regulator n=1 Tax=Paenibacillus sp. IITD108 TaxID=3116649 RepID=UPI002F41B373